jgi:undecaprenyl-diphosphatase
MSERGVERTGQFLTTHALLLLMAWCVLMAFNRVYPGVHYASDVIAGLMAGVAWVAVCISALGLRHRRRGGAQRV